MDKITVVCHKDHVVGYEDYRGQCLLCVVEDLMREVGRLTAACKEKEWVGLSDEEREHFRKLGFVGVLAVENTLKEKNSCST